MKSKKLYKSVEETHQLAKEILEKYADVRIFCLYGDLGSGKTTFTQGMAKELGITGRVTSPTFLMVKRYLLERQASSPDDSFHSGSRSDRGVKRLVSIPNITALYHLDLYRVQSKHDLDGLGVEEILEDSENIVVIEWPERLGELLPKKRVDIKFSFISEHVREIEVIAVV